MRKAVYLPEADRSETIELPVSCALLHHGQGNVLFDTGCHPSVPEDPEGRWGGLAKLMVPIMQPGDHVSPARRSRARARRHRHRRLLASAPRPLRLQRLLRGQHSSSMPRNSPPPALRAEKAAGYLAAEWEQPMPVDEIEDQRDVFGDGRIILIPLPGHTPGIDRRADVTLERSGRFLLAADTVACARRSTPASSRATPGIPRHSRNHSPRSGGSRPATLPSCAAMTTHNRRDCGRGPTPTIERSLGPVVQM